MASKTDETFCYCLSDENNRDKLSKDHPSVSSLRLRLQQLGGLCFLGNHSMWKRDTEWVLLRWVGGFIWGKELQRSDEVNADSRFPQLNILVSPQLSIAHSLKVTLPSLFCLSPALLMPLSVFFCFLLILIKKTFFFYLSSSQLFCQTFSNVFNSSTHRHTYWLRLSHSHFACVF